MANKPISNNSIINLFPEIVYDKEQSPQKSLDIWNNYIVTFLPRTSKINPYETYRPQQSDRLGDISQRYYGTPKLYWLILMVNEVDDPFTFLESVVEHNLNDGVIKVLKPEYVPQILLSLQRIKAVNDQLNVLNGE